MNTELKPKLLLSYWNVRGRTQPIRYFLEYLGLPYEEKRYTLENWQEWFVNDKPKSKSDFPNLPTLQDGDTFVTETDAIFHYLAHKANKPETVGKIEDQVKLLTTRGVTYDIAHELGNAAYKKEYADLIGDVFEKKVNPKLNHYNNYLENRKYLAGDYITFYDFVLYEGLEIVTLHRKDGLDNFKNVLSYKARIADLDCMKNYFKSERYIHRPFYGPAHFNPMD